MGSKMDIGHKSIYENPKMVKDSERIVEHRKNRTRRKSQLKALKESIQEQHVSKNTV